MNWRAFLIVDFKDLSNWLALAIAIPLLFWGIKTMIKLSGLTKGMA